MKSAQQARLAERVLICVVYCLISFVFGLEAAVFGPTANLLAEQTHDPDPTRTARGHQGARTQRHTVGFILLPHCANVVVLTVVYGLVSMTFTCVNTGVNCLVIRLYSDPVTHHTDSRATGAWLNTIGVTFGVGGLVVPQLVNLSACMWHDGAIYSYYIIAVLAGITTVLTWLLPHVEEPAEQGHATSGSKARSYGGAADNLSAPLLSAHTEGEGGGLPHGGEGTGLNSEESASWANSPHGQQEEGAVQEAAQQQQQQPTPWLFFSALLVIVFANIGLELALGGWVFTYGTDYAKLSPVQSRQLTSLYWLTFTLGRVPAIFLASCFRMSTILLVSMPLALLGAGLPLIMGDSMALHPELLPVSVILIGLGIAAGFPCALSYATEYVAINGTLNGVLSTVAGLGATVFPFVIPWLAKQTFLGGLGFQWLMIMTLVGGLLQIGGLLCMMVTGSWLKSKKAAVGDLVRAEAAAGALSSPLLVQVDG
eukprot:gene31779-6976_t